MLQIRSLLNLFFKIQASISRSGVPKTDGSASSCGLYIILKQLVSEDRRQHSLNLEYIKFSKNEIFKIFRQNARIF